MSQQRSWGKIALRCGEGGTVPITKSRLNTNIRSDYVFNAQSWPMKNAYIDTIINTVSPKNRKMMIYIVVHITLALTLFRMVNWIGEHATDFGYGSTTLFEEPNESLALNFFIRALAPTVFIVLLSATTVAFGHAELRIGIYWVALYYYLLRFVYIFAMNIHQLINWSRFAIHTSFGIGAAFLAYHSLILPNRSLLPDLETIGNELWLAIFAFLYAAGNKVTLTGGPGNRRRNSFIEKNFNHAKKEFGELISELSNDKKLELLVYAVLIYENYSRPPFVRAIERLCFWRRQRTTGIMQVAGERALSDLESVKLGVSKLKASWLDHHIEKPYLRTRNTIGDYNKDSDYIVSGAKTPCFNKIRDLRWCDHLMNGGGDAGWNDAERDEGVGIYSPHLFFRAAQMA